MSKQLTSHISLLQNVGTILAITISTLALAVSVYEANILKSQQEAMVWPFIQVGFGYSEKGFRVEASNNGIGPALIQSMEVRYRDEPIRSYDELLDKIKPNRTIGYDRIKMSSFNQTVMKAGESRELFLMPWDEETREIVKEMSNVSLKLQYCSVLEDCWVFDSSTGKSEKGSFQAEVEFLGGLSH